MRRRRRAGAYCARVERLRALLGVLHRELIKFGAVGAVAFVVDVYLYNVLRTGWWPADDGPLSTRPVTAKVVSTSVAVLVAWLGNRYWTFRRRRRAARSRELVLFVVMNAGGLAIASACLVVSHYVLGLRSPLADNIAANGVGLVLGSAFRFWAYRTLVFTESRPDGQVSSRSAVPPKG